MRLKISVIEEASGGRLLCGNKDKVVTAFSTDSRNIKQGTMFVPIKGEKIDAHIFIENVFAAGAVASFSQDEDAFLPQDGGTVVLVEDTGLALQKVATYFREQFEFPIIGVTGSVGKTSAKEMISLALSSKLKVMKTAGNQNSQTGVPLTVFGLRKEQEVAVIEMGISRSGEMDRISNVVKPTHAVITNIGVSHIEFLKSRENILAEKLRIARHLSQDGTLFVNGDDDLLMELKEQFQGKVETFGMGYHCDWRAVDLDETPNGTFFSCMYHGDRIQVFVPIAGAHFVRNALVSLAVSHSLGVDMSAAVRAINAYKPMAMRQQLIKTDGYLIIDDSYNASPESMRGALDILSRHKTSRKIAVLGDMLELGVHAIQGHYQIGRYAADKGVDILVGVGELAREICGGFGEKNAYFFTNKSDAQSFLQKELQAGDCVLVKASRGMKLDQLVTVLTNKSINEEDNNSKLK